MKYQSEIIVKLKNGVRDPKGSALSTVLRRMQLDEDSRVSVGNYFFLEIEADTPLKAEEKTRIIADQVLSNPVLEEYEIRSIKQK